MFVRKKKVSYYCLPLLSTMKGGSKKEKSQIQHWSISIFEVKNSCRWKCFFTLHFNGVDFHFLPLSFVSFEFFFHSILAWVWRIFYTQGGRIIVDAIFTHSNKNKLFYEVIKIWNGQKYTYAHAQEKRQTNTKTCCVAREKEKDSYVNKFRSIKKSWISIYLIFFALLLCFFGFLSTCSLLSWMRACVCMWALFTKHTSHTKTLLSTKGKKLM